MGPLLRNFIEVQAAAARYFDVQITPSNFLCSRWQRLALHNFWITMNADELRPVLPGV